MTLPVYKHKQSNMGDVYMYLFAERGIGGRESVIIKR